MQAAVQRPVKFIIEIAPDQLPALITQVVRQLTTRPPTGTPRRPESDDDDAPVDELEPAHNLPPPIQNVPRPVAGSPPALPAPLAPHRYLGALCKHQHDYEHSGYSLRKRSNHGCVQCEKHRVLARKQAQARPAVVTPLHPEALDPTGRPPLPAHLALTAFLSPIVCEQAEHCYRGMPAWTLRYTADESCVMCTTYQSQRALAGD
jgi:hypothetical protein